jgi:hypothetical protein
MTVYCQNCGKDTADKPLSFYGNVICSEDCKKLLSERVYFRDEPPEAGSTWFCPHCAAENPLGDPRQELRPNCTSCDKPLDPGSASPPKKGGCGGMVLVAVCLAGLAGCFGSGDKVQRSVAGRSMETSPVFEPASEPAPGSAPVSRSARSAANVDPWTGEAVAPRNAGPVRGSGGRTYRYGAKFEPPVGRILHGMGQWGEGNKEYEQMLGSPDLSPASTLIFFAIGDWPRAWESRVGNLDWWMREQRDRGRIPHVEISLFGIPEGERREQSIDHEIASSDRYDERIADVARRIRNVGGPVFVRIGGEFNGDWFDYHPYAYPIAYRRIVEIFREQETDNAAFIWCYEPSAPGDFDVVDEHGPRWFPGADVIDWFGLDVFGIPEFAGGRGRAGIESKQDRSERFLRMAERYNRPVIIAETSAVHQELSPDPADGRRDWDEWFVPFFDFLEKHPNIMAFHYVNTDWRDIPQARARGWRDARINNNGYLSRRYVAEMRKPRYMHADDVPLVNGYAEAMAIGDGLPPEMPSRGSSR